MVSEKHYYIGTLKHVYSPTKKEKKDILTNFSQGSMIIEGRLEVISHQNENSVTQTKVIVKTRKGEKELDFLGEVPMEYQGKTVRLSTGYNDDGVITKIKHTLSGEEIETIRGSLKLKYIPQMAFFGKGQIIFGHACGGMKR